MNKQVRKFLLEEFPQGSYRAVVQCFLQRQRDKGLSPATIARQFYNLHKPPLRQAQDTPHNQPETSPPIHTLTHDHLKQHLQHAWLTYSPDTMRTMIGDVRQFWRWAKKHKHIPRNIAKSIKPVKTRRRRRRKAKAPPEAHILTIMRNTAVPLIESGLLFKNFLGMLQTEVESWPYTAVMQLRDLFILTFIYETGCRAGELAKLGSAPMDRATATPAPIYLITTTGKTNDQDYYFTQSTAELWRIWQQVRPNVNRQYAIVSWKNGRSPQKATTPMISRMLLRRGRQSGLPPFRAHSLRHAKTRRSRKLIGIELTSFLIGHSDYDTTVGYDYIDDDELVTAVKKTGLQEDIWGRSE